MAGLRTLRWILPALLVCVGIGMRETSLFTSEAKVFESQPTVQRILEVEETARLLAILLDSGRNVINDNQSLFDDPTMGDKGFTPDAFEEQLIDMFRMRSGIDLRTLESAGIPKRAEPHLRALARISKEVVAEAQPVINEKGVGYKGFIPAIFGARVAALFSAESDVLLGQRALHARNPTNRPDPFERAALLAFADPSYPREKVISEATSESQWLRLMYPLYATRQCLECHGEPKGELDRTGYPKEGLRLGQNAGAISVIIAVKE